MKLTEDQFNYLTGSIAQVIGRPANDILPHGDHKWVLSSPYGPVSIYAGQYSESIYWYFDRHTPPGDYQGLQSPVEKNVFPTKEGTWHIHDSGSAPFMGMYTDRNCLILCERLKALKMLEDGASADFEQDLGVTNQEIVKAINDLLDDYHTTVIWMGGKITEEGPAMVEARRIIKELNKPRR